jgi:hypothetical protein
VCSYVRRKVAGKDGTKSLWRGDRGDVGAKDGFCVTLASTAGPGVEPRLCIILAPAREARV